MNEEQEEEQVRKCPLCGEEIHSLDITYPAQLGSIDLDAIPETGETIVDLDVVPPPIVTCPECKEVIPEKTLEEWNVRLRDNK